MPSDGPDAGRRAATITRVEKNYCVASSDDEASPSEYFVRTTSMRARIEWAKLKVGDKIQFSIRVMAGRGIISDVVITQ